MRRRGLGISFITISALLISTKYLSAGIFGSSVVSWSEELFNAMLDSVGNTLSNLSILSLIIGILYLVWGEYEEFNIKNKN
ncbi:hypothetical protein V7056_19545 [Bacillus sp. JJ664]